MFSYRVYSKILFRVALIAACFCLTTGASAPTTAEYRAAAVESFNGEIVMVPASQPLPPQARLGSMSKDGAPAILTYSGDVSVISSPQSTLPPPSQRRTAVPDGCRIITKLGASATLTLPDRSYIRIREMSILELNGFAWNTQANSRGMLMSLYAGSVRVVLASAPQERGSFFEIKTPNALMSLHFSQPDVEVIYAPSPMENMAALLEEGTTLEEEEATLWKDVLLAREEHFLRRQREHNMPVQTAALPAGTAQFRVQNALAKVGLTQSEENALLQARLLQQDKELTHRVAQAVQVADASASGPFLPQTEGVPPNFELEQWQTDGLITGDDDVGKGTTFVFAYTVNVNFMNRITREIRTIQHGQRAVVRGRGITMTVLNGNPMKNDPPRNLETTFALDSQGQMTALDNAEESGSQSQENASSSGLFPGSAGRRHESWVKRPRPHNVEIVLDEKSAF